MNAKDLFNSEERVIQRAESDLETWEHHGGKGDRLFLGLLKENKKNVPAEHAPGENGRQEAEQTGHAL